MSYLTASWNVMGINKYWIGLILPAIGFYIGKRIDDEEKLRSTSFRDKSALFGGKLKPGDPPSWPTS